MRMMAKSTSKMEFFDKNKEMAMGLAVKEMADAKEKAKETQVQIRAAILFYLKVMFSFRWMLLYFPHITLFIFHLLFPHYLFNYSGPERREGTFIQHNHRC